MKDYLTDEEQYKEVLTSVEISRIKDPELRRIREKYSIMRHKAFIDEHNIPDAEFVIVYNKLIQDEQKELAAYKAKKEFNCDTE